MQNKRKLKIQEKNMNVSSKLVEGTFFKFRQKYFSKDCQVKVKEDQKHLFEYFWGFSIKWTSKML